MGICESTSPEATTVLIVDDEEPIRHIVNRILQSAGYITRLAANGADALAVAEGADPIDLLVTDMMMPEMNGDEVARRLRQKYQTLKVLYFTGYGDHLFDEKGTMWEGEAFLEKPCGAKGLLEAVSLLLNRNQCFGDVFLGQLRRATEIPANG